MPRYKCNQMAKNSHSGLTLVELLVALTVVSMLAALSVPALQAARAAARRTHCVSNLRQIGLAIAMYQDAHSGEFPRTSHGAPEEVSWIYTLRPFLQNVDRVRICPDDPRARERIQLRLSSYVLNEFVSVPLVGPFGEVLESYTNQRRLRDPTRTIVVFEGADHLALSVLNDHTHSRGWVNPNVWAKVLADIQPDRHRAQPPAPQRDRGQANYLFADGHVETWTAAKLRQLVESGHNPARPPD